MRQQFRFNTPPYVLRKSELYRLWKERLFRELTQMGLIDLVDDTAPKIQRDLRQLKVSRDMTMNIIISRLDQDHHRVVQGQTDPKIVISMLDAFRQPKTHSNEMMLLRKLNSLQYTREKYENKPEMFIHEFEDLVMQLENVGEMFTDERKKKAFIMAVDMAHPEIKRELHLTQGRMKYNQCKLIFLEEEATLCEQVAHKDSKEEDTSKAMFAGHRGQRRDGPVKSQQ